MVKPYAHLRAKMSPADRRAAQALADAMEVELGLGAVRRVREVSQAELAAVLDINQPAVSKLERRLDMRISTLRDYAKALGGELDLTIRFPDGDIRINQFDPPKRKR